MFFFDVPQGQAFFYTTAQTALPCQTLFLAAASKVIHTTFEKQDKLNLQRFSQAACLTSNPDVLWQIAYVESGFKMRIVQIDGKKTLTGDAAEKYLAQGLPKDANVDIGPLQINWKANGSKWNYDPSRYLDGAFSVSFLSNHILKDYVNSCKENWVSCYHSRNKLKGNAYSQKIIQSETMLKRILWGFFSHR